MRSKQLALRPQDIVILLKKISPSGWSMDGKQVAASLGISQSEVSESLARSRVSGLLDSSRGMVNTRALKDLLVYGIRFVFPVVPEGIVRGIPTGPSASPMTERLVQGSESFVWPSTTGQIRGQAILPLYPTVPAASEKDADLYALLVATDALRFGRARERDRAIEILDQYFLKYVGQQ